MISQVDADETQKALAINALAANFGKALVPELLSLWLDLLEPYSPELVQAAVRRVVERYEYKTLPPFAVLKNALNELTGIGTKTLEIQAVAEWGVLMDAIVQTGFYGHPDLHPTTAYVLRLMGGWESACHWDLDSLDFKRRDFLRLWAESHGRVEHMQLGAGSVLKALASGQDRQPGPRHLGTAIRAAITEVQQ